jgi:hypothetical protein
VAEAASFSSDAGSIAHGKLSPAARLTATKNAKIHKKKNNLFSDQQLIHFVTFRASRGYS